MSHRPSFHLWTELLEKKSYVQIQDPSEMDRLLLSIPYSSSSRAAKIWITENSRVIALLDPEERRVFTLGKGAPSQIPPGTWEPLGHGWEAFQALHERKVPELPKPSAPRKNDRSGNWDPREIRY